MSADSGKFSIEKTPYLREILEAFQSDDWRELYVIKCARMGFTLSLLVLMGYFVVETPGNILFVGPTAGEVKSFFKQQLNPFIRNCPPLETAFSRAARPNDDRKQETTTKYFAGGYLSAIGGVAAAGFRGKYVRLALVDELGGFDAEAGNEGDQIELLKKRGETDDSFKLIAGSTPTIEGLCKITQQYQDTDRRRYYVPCPHCGHYQPLTWPRLRWERGKPETAQYQCAGCEKLIHESAKFEMLAAGRWVPENPANPRRGYKLGPALYSPFVGWSHHVTEFLAAKDEPGKLKVWVNTTLGEPFKIQEITLHGNALYQKRERYSAEVPMRAGILTCGVDVQHNRLEASVYGWGVGEEGWLIEHRIFDGDTSAFDVWRQLDAYLESSFQHESGFQLKISVTLIDAGDGNRTKMVYDFCAPRAIRKIFPLKGDNKQDSPLVRTTRVGVRRQPMVLVGRHTALDIILPRLARPAHVDGDFIPGTIHLPTSLTIEQCDQFASQALVRKRSGGKTRLIYETRLGEGYRRDEMLDCAVYALAGLEISGANVRKIVANLRRSVKNEEVDEAMAEPSPPSAPERPARVVPMGAGQRKIKRIYSKT